MPTGPSCILRRWSRPIQVLTDERTTSRPESDRCPYCQDEFPARLAWTQSPEGIQFMARVQHASSIAHGLPTTGWRGLLLGVTIVHLLNGVALTILAGTLYPTYVVFPVLWIIGILRLRRGHRAGLLWLGITGL